MCVFLRGTPNPGFRVQVWTRRRRVRSTLPEMLENSLPGDLWLVSILLWRFFTVKGLLLPVSGKCGSVPGNYKSQKKKKKKSDASLKDSKCFWFAMIQCIVHCKYRQAEVISLAPRPRCSLGYATWTACYSDCMLNMFSSWYELIRDSRGFTQQAKKPIRCRLHGWLFNVSTHSKAKVCSSASVLSFQQCTDTFSNATYFSR